jgi:hypothetical protein
MNEYYAVLLEYVFLDSVGYNCKGIADEVLDDIRADTGVKEIFCVPERGTEPETSQEAIVGIYREDFAAP